MGIDKADMPIDGSEWDDAEVPTSGLDQIRTFLRENSEKAYTSAEIAGEIQNIDESPFPTVIDVQFSCRLDILVEKGEVDERAIPIPDEDRFEVYYRIASR